MILHLLSDDKFTDYAISQFDAVAPNQNRFVILTYTDNYVCKYIKQIDAAVLVVVGSPEYKDLCNNLANYKAIVTHNLSTSAQVHIIKSAPVHVKIAWVFWGFEVYSRNEHIKKCLGTQTRFIYNKYLFKQYLKAILKRITSGEKYARVYQVPKEIFKRVDFCLTDLKEDFELARKSFKCNFQWAWYNYYSIEDTIGSLVDSNINGENILIGNSSSTTNNHLETFKFLKKLNIGKRKIISPLSYGDGGYGEFIQQEGKINFGENFVPLTVFIDREEYNKILLSCSVVIMNHYRHQAMGNIITALWLGARVYLSKQTTTYLYFKRLGVHFYSIEDDLNPVNKNVLEPLPLEKAIDNRKILAGEYGKENVLQKVRQVVDLLNG